MAALVAPELPLPGLAALWEAALRRGTGGTPPHTHRSPLTCSSCSMVLAWRLSSCSCSVAPDSRSHSLVRRAATALASRPGEELSSCTRLLRTAIRWPRWEFSDPFSWGAERRKTVWWPVTAEDAPAGLPKGAPFGLDGRDPPYLQAPLQPPQLQLQPRVLLQDLLAEAPLEGRLPQRLGQLQVKPGEGDTCGCPPITRQS